MKKKKAIPIKVRNTGVKRFHKHGSYSCNMTLAEEVPGANRKRPK